MGLGRTESIAGAASGAERPPARKRLRILLCCEFYAPSVGGVQEVVRQVAEHLVQRGHEVTVATSDLPERRSTQLNGVDIKGFQVSGNFVRGLAGSVDQYVDFVTRGAFDVVMIKAAQQWTFDALWEALPKIPGAKIFIPCGFSALYEPSYREYFERLPDILRQFDQLIFYAQEYRDVAFCKTHGLPHLTFLTNGASEVEFSQPQDPQFRKRYGIGPEDYLFLTVGNPPRQKGQIEVAEAFDLLECQGRRATLLLNGEWRGEPTTGRWRHMLREDLSVLREHGFLRMVKNVAKRMLLALQLDGLVRRLGYQAEPTDRGLLGECRRIYREHGAMRMAKYGVKQVMISCGLGPLLHWMGYEVDRRRPVALEKVLRRVERHGGTKRILVANLPRPDLIQAYLAADVFVFASHVEYSPLVLFEAAAAGTPFLTVPVGNAEEIVRWTGGGVICPAQRDPKGYTVTDPAVLAAEWSRVLADESLRHRLGEEGRRRWDAEFTWEKVTDRYESLFYEVLAKKGVPA